MWALSGTNLRMVPVYLELICVWFPVPLPLFLAFLKLHPPPPDLDGLCRLCPKAKYLICLLHWFLVLHCFNYEDCNIIISLAEA